MAGEQTIRRPDFNGKWVVYKNENFEEYMAANGAPWIARKMVGKSTPTIIVTQDDEKITFSMVGKIMSREETCTFGVAYEQKEPDGSVSKALGDWEGDKLVINYEPKEAGKRPNAKVTRFLQDGEMVVEMQCGNVTARRYLKKQD